MMVPVEFPDGPPSAIGDWLVWYVGTERLEGRVIEMTEKHVRIDTEDGHIRKVFL